MTDELYRRFQRNYDNGYYNYVVTLTFKPNGVYATTHPRTASIQFAKTFSKYLAKKKGIDYYLVPEMSRNGALHYHGVLFCKSNDYDRHEKTMKMLKNYAGRIFGRHQIQRIYSLSSEYEAECIQNYLRNKTLTTSFEQIWDYIHKDQTDGRRFTFLKVVTNL